MHKAVRLMGKHLGRPRKLNLDEVLLVHAKGQAGEVIMDWLRFSRNLSCPSKLSDRAHWCQSAPKLIGGLSYNVLHHLL